MKTITAVYAADHIIHARPAAVILRQYHKMIKDYSDKRLAIRARNISASKEINLASIMSIMMSEVDKNSQVEVEVSGEGLEEEALKSIADSVCRYFEYLHPSKDYMWK